MRKYEHHSYTSPTQNSVSYAMIYVQMLFFAHSKLIYEKLDALKLHTMGEITIFKDIKNWFDKCFNLEHILE